MARQKKFTRYVTLKEFLPGDFEITSKINSSYKTVDRSRKGLPSVSSARSSLRRAHKKLDDLLRSNEWSYFITLTFAFDGLGADDLCRSAFSRWSKRMKADYPNLYYVAVPEYHKKGDLHYHIVVGGVSASDLMLSDSGRVLHCGKAWKRDDFFSRGFVYDESTGEGMPIYNVGAWPEGFSTATEVRDTTAVSRYVSKYLTKCDLDPRFYNKKRFHTSHNIARPKVTKSSYSHSSYCNDDYDLTSLGVVPTYRKPSLRLCKYKVTDDDKVDIIRLRLSGVLPMPSHFDPSD